MIIVDNFIEIHNDYIKIREATKQGYAITIGDSVNLEQLNSKTRRGRVDHQIVQTLTTSCNQGIVIKGDDSINKVVTIGQASSKNSQAGKIYSSNGLFPTVCACTHGYAIGYITDDSKNKQINRSDDNMWKNNLEQFKFNMEDIKVFDSFAGKGALHKSLTKLGVPIKLVGISEVDPDSIIDYATIHLPKSQQNEVFNYPEKEEIQKWLIDRNIGWDFKKEKSSIPRMKLDKLKKLYKASVLLNNLGDISKINPSDIPSFDMFNFSFPCTDISVSGKQEGMKDKEGNITRSGLYIYGINIIKAKKPKYIMIENVKNLISKKFIGDFNEIINQIEEMGYTCYYPTKDNGQPKCLNAKDYGIPQNRERIFVICVKNDIKLTNFEFPKGFDNGVRLKHLLEYTVDEKYYLSDEIQRKFKLNYSKDKNHNELNMLGMLDIKGNDQIRRVYDEKGLSPTLSTMQGGNRQPKVLQEVNFKIRKLTPLECWRLMGFDDEDFYAAKSQGTSDSQLYKQAGNSIVVNCLYYIFKELFKEHIIK